jgi:hypothetical protein
MEKPDQQDIEAKEVVMEKPAQLVQVDYKDSLAQQE